MMELYLETSSDSYIKILDLRDFYPEKYRDTTQLVCVASRYRTVATLSSDPKSFKLHLKL